VGAAIIQAPAGEPLRKAEAVQSSEMTVLAHNLIDNPNFYP
jgi:hypothetical protein